MDMDDLGNTALARNHTSNTTVLMSQKFDKFLYFQNQPDIITYVENFLTDGFLNSTRSGSAQKQFGQTFQQFLSTITISLVCSVIQILVFFVLKEKLKDVYEPNVVLESLLKGSSRCSKNLGGDVSNVNTKERFKSCDKIFEHVKFPLDYDIEKAQNVHQLCNNSKTGFTSSTIFYKLVHNCTWIKKLVFDTPLEQYQYIGLDSYFILRFLSILYRFFFLMAVTIMPILIPVHFYNTNTMQSIKSDINLHIEQKNNMGLDTISMSNLSVKKSHILIVHFSFTVFVVCSFHYMLLRELKFYIKTKIDFIHWLEKNHDISKFFHDLWNAQTILFVDNLPNKNLKYLSTLFEKLNENCVDAIWFIPLEYKKLLYFEKNHLKILTEIETLELDLILINLEKQKQDSVGQTALLKWPTLNLNMNIFPQEKDLSLFKDYQVKIHYNTVYFNLFQEVDKQYKIIDLSFNKYFKNLKKWYDCQNKTIKESKHPENLHNKLFIKFNNVYSAHIFNQLILHEDSQYMNNRKTNINFQNIIWSNIAQTRSTRKFLKRCLSNIIGIAMIIGWIIPIFLIGIISQIPYLAKLIPVFKILYLAPKSLFGVFNIFVPVLSLMVLTEVLPMIFRSLGKFKGLISYSDIELNIQNWYFVFSFVHIFIVVTVSSGLSVILKQILNNPVSVPQMFASNFPKCSNFFCSFILIRGLSFFSGNLLQITRLINMSVLNVNRTPRQKYSSICEANSENLLYRWGSVYAIFSLLASISIIYCVIQPLILFLTFIIFALILVSFKYTLKYQNNVKNNSMETMGEFYPNALLQIYSGVYCLELLMLGLFFLSGCYRLSLLTVVVFVVTIVAHFQILKYYKGLLVNLPLSKYTPKSITNESVNNNINDSSLKKTTFEIVPKFKNIGLEDIIWLPKDGHGICECEIERLKERYGSNIRLSNSHNKLDDFGYVNLI